MPRILSRPRPTSSNRSSSRIAPNSSFSDNSIFTVNSTLRRNISDLTCDMIPDVKIYATSSFCKRCSNSYTSGKSLQLYRASLNRQISCWCDAAKFGKLSGDTRTTASTVPTSTAGCSYSGGYLEEDEDEGDENCYNYQSYDYSVDEHDDYYVTEPPLCLSDAYSFVPVGAPHSYAHQDCIPTMTFAGSPPPSLAATHRMPMLNKQHSSAEFHSTDSFAKLLDNNEGDITITKKQCPVSLLSASLMPSVEDSSWGYFVDAIDDC